MQYDFEIASALAVYERHRMRSRRLAKTYAAPKSEGCDPYRIQMPSASSSGRTLALTHDLEVKMSAYRALIVGRHDRAIGVIQLDCSDDDAAITRAQKLVDGHDIELWQMDRPVARFDARSGEMRRK
jgi:hypothetical protein